MIKIFLALSILLFLNGCEKKRSVLASGKKVFIKIIASQSNEGIAYGIQGLQGLQAAKELHPFLPNGDEIIFDISDDASDTTQAKDILATIDDNITALLTFSNSDMQLYIASLIQKMKIPTLAVIATHDDFIKQSEYMTRLSMSNSIEAEVSAAYVRDEMLMNRVGIVYSEKSIYSKSVASYFREKFLTLGGEIAIDQSIESMKNTDINYQELLDIIDLDLIFITTDAIGSYQFLKKFNSLQSDVKIFVTDGLFSDMQKHYPKELKILDGVLSIDHYSHNMDENKHIKYLQSYFEDEKILISSFAGLGYEAYQLLYKALRLCPKYERTCINTKLRNSGVFDGVVSILETIDGDMQRPLYINEIQDAQMLRKVKVY